MRYTARHWNKLLKKVEAYFPRRFFSETTRLQQYTHPWTVTMGMDRFGNLTPFFYPGGVNGYPPYVEMKFSESPEKAQLRVLNDKSIDRTKPIRVYLDEGPTLPLRWRKYDPDEEDVKPPPFAIADSEIQATDIIVQTQRIALNLDVIKEVSQDFTGIQANPVYSNLAGGHGFQISSTAKFVPAKSNISISDIFAARFFDNPFEECKICTIFAVRQNTSQVSPDLTWLFATSYDAYYNLLYFAPFVPDQKALARFSFASPLAGGALQATVIAQQLFATNDLFSQAFTDFAARARLRGSYHAI